MCRVLGYLGPSLPLEDLMTRPANSLVNQSFSAKFHHLLQLGGSGFASWERGSVHEEQPLLYKSSTPAFFDAGLRTICENTRTTALLAHLRAILYTEEASISRDNCHPFLYPGLRLALAHNGGMQGWRNLLYDVLMSSRPEIVANLSGGTDTEALYCLLMSQFDDPRSQLTVAEIVDGLGRFMRTLVKIKENHSSDGLAKLKLYLADGNNLVVANLGLGKGNTRSIDGDWRELRTHPVDSAEFALSGVLEPAWFITGDHFEDHDGTYEMEAADLGEATTVIAASEPLTRSSDAWQPVPFQHVAVFERRGDRIYGGVGPLTF